MRINAEWVFSMKNKKKHTKEKVKEALNGFFSSKRETIDLLAAVSEIRSAVEDINPEDKLSVFFNELATEIVGLSTETYSQKEKIVQSSTIKVVTEYILSYLNTIEREIINSSRTKMKLQQKIKKLINEYLSTNYFKRLIIITMVDDIIESVYGDDYFLSKYIYNLIKDDTNDKEEFEKFFSIYVNIIDSSDIPDFKISFRKAILEKKYIEDILCDFWLKLEEFIGEQNCLKVLNSLSLFKAKKMAYNKEVLNPIIYALKDSKYYITDDFKKLELNGKVYYGGAIYTLEDNNIKFETFITKLRNFNYNEEAELLYTYLVNNINLLTDKIITEKFSGINPELFEELVYLNEHKLRQTGIGYILISDPSENIFNQDGSLNFIVSLVMKSIYKMSEILLINDFEFQEFQKEMLITLQQISKLRDIETAKHQERVTIYTQILAEELKRRKEEAELDLLIAKNNILADTDYYIIDEEYVRDLVYSASLHDLGKVGIDDVILKNPKKLTEDEYEIMKKHTTLGYQRLNSIVKMSRKKSFLILAAALAENHHERWDGKGYPNYKKGFEIPLSARILAIADVYDALRQKRTYKDPFSHEKAVHLILSEKSKHFDPVLVDIFFEKNSLFNEAFITNNV